MAEKLVFASQKEEVKRLSNVVSRYHF